MFHKKLPVPLILPVFHKWETNPFAGSNFNKTFN